VVGTAVVVIAVVLGLHAVLKFAFFLLPYRRRRSELDRSYRGRLTATRVQDTVSLVVVIAVVAALFAAGVQPPSFLIGLWCGATLIQVYFHEFHDPLGSSEAPPEPAGPIKTMSYAIQAAPARAWREMALFSVLMLAGIAAMII